MYEKAFEPAPYIIGAIIFYLISLAITHAIIRGAVRQANLKTEMLLRLNARILAEMALVSGVDRSLLDKSFEVYNTNVATISVEDFKYPTLAKEKEQEFLLKRKLDSNKRAMEKIKVFEAEIEKLKSGKNAHKRGDEIAELSSNIEALKKQLGLTELE